MLVHVFLPTVGPHPTALACAHCSRPLSVTRPPTAACMHATCPLAACLPAQGARLAKFGARMANASLLRAWNQWDSVAHEMRRMRVFGKRMQMQGVSKALNGECHPYAGSSAAGVDAHVPAQAPAFAHVPKLTHDESLCLCTCACLRLDRVHRGAPEAAELRSADDEHQPHSSAEYLGGAFVHAEGMCFVHVCAGGSYST